MSRISALSSNALLTKSRAMNSHILTDEDYAQLVNCRSYNDIMAYLKANTVYEKIVGELYSRNIYRARLEAEIRKFNNSRIAELAAFENAIGQSLHEIIYLKNDVRLILSCANHLDTSEISDYSLLTPEAYFKHSDLNPDKLEMATSLTEFYEALGNTPYKKALDVFVVGKAPFYISSLENTLYRYMYSQITPLVKKNYTGDSQKQIFELLHSEADYRTLESIYRMKRFFPGEQLTLNNISYSGFSAFTVNEIEQMMAADSTDELFRLFKKGDYARYFDEKAKGPIELCTRLALLKANRKRLLFSTEPEVTMLAFIGILENETKNLIHIIEGVRYRLSGQQILDFIVT